MLDYRRNCLNFVWRKVEKAEKKPEKVEKKAGKS